MKAWVSTITASSVIEAIFLAAIDWRSFCSFTVSFRRSSLLCIPLVFFASSNITVPKIDTLTLMFFCLSMSTTLETTVVLPTPGIPTMITRLLSAKQSTQGRHYFLHPFPYQQVVIVNQDVNCEQHSGSGTKGSKDVGAPGQESKNHGAYNRDRRDVFLQEVFNGLV